MTSRCSWSRGTLERAGETVESGIEGLIALGEAETHDRPDRIRGVEGRHRNGRNLVLDHEPLAEGLVVLVAAEGGKIDIEEIGALGIEHRKAQSLEALREAVAAPLQPAAHVLEIIVALA